MLPADQDNDRWQIYLRRISRTICRIFRAIKSKAMPIATTILLIAAIWYCLKISSFSLLSEDEARSWLGFNEALLIAASVLLLIGLFGEYPDSETWKKTKWYKAGKMAVILGVLGEVVGDGGIFESERRLQELENKTIGAQNAEIIALLKHGLARSINVAEFAKRLETAPPSNAEIRYVLDCGDCESLSLDISDALHKADWKVGPPIPIDPIDRNWVKAVRSLHANSTGITDVFKSPDMITGDPKRPMAALDGALSQLLGFGFNGYDLTNTGSVDPTMPPDTFRIVVAPKP